MDDQGREVDAHHIPAMPCSRPNVLREMYVLPDETFFYYSCWDGDRPAVLVRLTPQWTIDTRSEMAAKPEAITKIDADYYRLYRQTPRVSVILNGEPLVPTDTTVDSTGNFLVRLNGQGDTLNVEEYFWSGLHEMVPLPEGGLAMAGDWRVARTGDRWAQGTDSLARTILVGTDNNGEILWKVDTLPMDEVRVLKVCDDGGLLVAGGKENAGGTKGVVVMKFEPEVTIAARDDMRPRPGAASLQARTPAPTRYVDLRGRHVADGSPGRGGGGSTASGILIGFTEKGLRTRLIVGD